DFEQERTPPPEGYRIGMWLAVLSMSILFISLNVLYFYNNAGRKPIVMPKVLWASTGLLLLSSLTIEMARRALRRRRENLFRNLTLATLLLGLAFLIAQLLAWQSLQQSGFYVNRNFRSGYAYIFTALHGLHLIGGLWGLIYVLTRRTADWTMLRRRVSVDVTVFYWHFLDGLWLYLWLLVFVWK
ncbi:MAG: cytochrome c oxidase subunit 3, partial [Acidobacteriota bacterium]